MLLFSSGTISAKMALLLVPHLQDTGPPYPGQSPPFYTPRLPNTGCCQWVLPLGVARKPIRPSSGVQGNAGLQVMVKGAASRPQEGTPAETLSEQQSDVRALSNDRLTAFQAQKKHWYRGGWQAISKHSAMIG